ncbi:tetratricopeptide repeat protein [Streptomyces sp. NPDC015171]|uniref:tetratricopeptide repeat protein n=1 Tax=Streptomyces sp. NPDC015171 TaxID=3364945 RepID=UPI0036FC2F4C
MFSRRNDRTGRSRRPGSPALRTAWEALDAGDVPGALRQVRAAGEDQPLGEVALVVGRAAGSAGFDDLAAASAALTAAPEEPRALYDFGYACVERGVPALAIPALREALRRSDGALPVLRELVSAYEDESRHREAMTELARHENRLQDWPDRYLLVFNAVLAGDLDLARRQHALLSEPADARWQPARERQNRMLARAADAERAGPLDLSDLRGWQFVLGGTVLGTLSPHGFDAGMNGRYAWLQDTPELCLRGLLRLRALLSATGVRPRSVSLLPDRDSRILGLAAAEVLGLPAEPFAPGRADTVVVAYDLDGLAAHEGGPELTGELFERAPGQVLHAHASCWTDPPAVTPDSTALLHQSVVAPWGEQLRQGADGGVERGPADDRPEAEIAAGITAADPSADPGDGAGPADGDAEFTAFATAVAGTWLHGDRARVRSTGPVPSSRFA